MSNTLILSADSYKYSHVYMLPQVLEGTYFYVTARQAAKNLENECIAGMDIVHWDEFVSSVKPGLFDNVIYLGAHGFINKYLAGQKINNIQLNVAKQFAKDHGIPFNEFDFFTLKAEQESKGSFWPVAISSLPEGSLVPVGTPLVTVQSMDKRFPWLPGFIETALLRSIWYPTTVASIAWQIRQLCKYFLKKTAEDEVIDPVLRYMLHDFGARGVSSAESAAIGGMAHLTQFYGTDNPEGYMYAVHTYGASMEGLAHSCPAAEHSTIMGWGPDKEAEAYKHIIAVHQDYPIVSIVSDTYDLENSLHNLWGNELVDIVEASKARVVVRPDSGDPVIMVIKTLRALKQVYGGTFNKKGYFVLPPCIRVLQGDGVNLYSIFNILLAMKREKFSAENIVFGMGGALLQKLDRDTYFMAMKLSAVWHKGYTAWQGVKKTVATDSRKVSRAGRFHVAYSDQYSWQVSDLDNIPAGLAGTPNQLAVVWDGLGESKPPKFSDIRARAQAY